MIWFCTVCTLLGAFMFGWSARGLWQERQRLTGGRKACRSRAARHTLRAGQVQQPSAEAQKAALRQAELRNFFHYNGDRQPMPEEVIQHDR